MFKKIIHVLGLAALFAFGVAAQPPDPAVAFDKAYYLHQPPEVRELLDGATNGAAGGAVAQQSRSATPSWTKYTDQDARLKRIIELAGQGFILDVPIDLWGWDPYKVMALRVAYGYAWVPSALQAPVSAAPGLSGPGITPYDPTKPPAGSIPVSLDPAAYPPFDPPVTPVGNIISDPVGAYENYGNLFYCIVGDRSADGTVFTGPRGTFTKHTPATPFGKQCFWTQEK